MLTSTLSSFKVQCKNCKKEFPVEANVSIPSPINRAQIEPYGLIYPYRITSDEIKTYLTQKAKHFKPGIKIELASKYCEKKKRESSDPHMAHASFTIAFSDDVIERKGDVGWFDRMGQNDSNVRFIDDIFVGFIRKYQYNRKDLDDILDDYKKLEYLESKYGITEQFIEDVKTYCTPRRIPTNANESWILFSARADKIIEDMLEHPGTDTVAGRISIDGRVYQINKDTVEFVVYVHPNEIESSEDPLVRQLLTGKKLKK